MINVLLFCQRFLFFLKSWQNSRVSKRKNGNEISYVESSTPGFAVPLNSVLCTPISAGRLHSCTYGSAEFSGLQILKYCIQQTFFFGFLNVGEKVKSCKILLCSSMQFC